MLIHKTMNSIYILLLSFLLVNCDPVGDEVTFPNWPTYAFKTYSGYLSVGGGNRQYHYVFLQSQGNPATDPLVLWLNGGPGCSSVLGLLTELGPFLLDDTKATPTFKADDGFGWNKNANVIFLESPAGVGFSTITDTDKATYVYNDANTAADNYAALQGWFKSFTSYQGRDFYIAGESYAGMYVPFTANAVLTGNKDAAKINIKLKGILIGNGLLVTDEPNFYSKTQTDYYVNRNLFDYRTKEALQNQCQVDPTSVSCTLAYTNLVKVVDNLNVYNIYGYCFSTDTTEEQYKTPLNNLKYPYVNRFLPDYLKDASGPPCTSAGPSTNYLNGAATKNALHITPTTVQWVLCNDDINKNYQSDPVGSYAVLPVLKAAGVRILIYSGDQDAAVSVENTLASIVKMKIKETAPWTPVADETKLVTGWLTKYDILDFFVVRAAGHMVPSDQRKVAFTMFDNFLKATSQPAQTE